MKYICFECKSKCVEGDYCYGCRQSICPQCNKNYLLSGSHSVEEHLSDPDAETVDEG